MGCQYIAQIRSAKACKIVAKHDFKPEMAVRDLLGLHR